ncbi:probable protein phosphatase 2C 59 [Camellia sinensis]|uniref:probable protein phosphatase 2C 59 n=1 Tax=Camellia sinensis TaxID=4442 RepID=UPI0010365236|nr:probable protein phosphatase 2C 59 [Camellia sinensis]XP_028093643.1 probable protein phosphatase 2C 59 [Camellia sinensis]XP_028093644.1 probable protein phosphatase 2C 59 [Camellia sinensis]
MEDFYETRIDGVDGEIVGLFGVFDDSQNGKFNYGYASSPGKRSTMEDFYETRIDGLDGEIVGLFGVFDDVQTQAMYQLLDSGFIGLIFSCFSEDVHKVGRIQVIAFQSLDGKQNHMLRALPVRGSIF